MTNNELIFRGSDGNDCHFEIDVSPDLTDILDYSISISSSTDTTDNNFKVEAVAQDDDTNSNEHCKTKRQNLNSDDQERNLRHYPSKEHSYHAAGNHHNNDNRVTLDEGEFEIEIQTTTSSLSRYGKGSWDERLRSKSKMKEIVQKARNVCRMDHSNIQSIGISTSLVCKNLQPMGLNKKDTDMVNTTFSTSANSEIHKQSNMEVVSMTSSEKNHSIRIRDTILKRKKEVLRKVTEKKNRLSLDIEDTQNLLSKLSTENNQHSVDDDTQIEGLVPVVSSDIVDEQSEKVSKPGTKLLFEPSSSSKNHSYDDALAATEQTLKDDHHQTKEYDDIHRMQMKLQVLSDDAAYVSNHQMVVPKPIFKKFITTKESKDNAVPLDGSRENATDAFDDCKENMNENKEIFHEQEPRTLQALEQKINNHTGQPIDDSSTRYLGEKTFGVLLKPSSSKLRTRKSTGTTTTNGPKAQYSKCELLQNDCDNLPGSSATAAGIVTSTFLHKSDSIETFGQNTTNVVNNSNQIFSGVRMTRKMRLMFPVQGNNNSCSSDNENSPYKGKIHNESTFSSPTT